MSDLSKEINAVFTGLVGSEAAIADFQANLSERIASHADAPDAFSRLENATNNVIQLAINYANNLPPDDSGSTLPRAWQQVWANSLQGSHITTGVLTAISDIYVRRAHVPQTIDGVERNTDRSLRYAYGNAFNDGYTAAYNQTAIRTGRNPANRLNKPFLFMNLLYKGPNHATPHRRAFRVATGKDGQLEIQPRHPLVNSKSEEHCPAADARIEVANESPSALLTFMRTISSVAMRDIYPHRFAMVPSE